ncbi:MAG: protein-L-isoaspartate O-methyltransferase [Thermoprotei archaeon]|nr:MAG: protein-L-isoaspartate O-methyltransferase [Thermoprotei archaeon]
MRTNFEDQRRDLVKRLVREGYIRSKLVAKAFSKVPREKFVPPRYREYSYYDTPLPTLKGQTISAPHMCAIMCEELDLKPGDFVLAVGTGSGYHAALCAEIVARSGDEKRGHVCSIEIDKDLTKFAYENLKTSGYDLDVSVVCGDGSFTPPFRYKFNKILVTAAAPRIPNRLLESLEIGGTMVIPIGTEFMQELSVVIKRRDGVIVMSAGPCVFVKLRGVEGFSY